MCGEYITITDACKLLDVSRPTLDMYRKKYGIKDYPVKGRVFFKTIDILEELYKKSHHGDPDLSFTVTENFNVEEIEIAPGIFDIHRIRTIDSFGAICFLCCLMGRIQTNKHVYLLINKSSVAFKLKEINFFHELCRSKAEYVHYDDSIFEDIFLNQAEVIIPLHVIGYRGAEKGILDNIYDKLRRQGFSEELCASLGWTLGELADNTATHAGGVPCYFMLSSSTDSGPCKFLSLTIGDIGQGIPATLRSNSNYQTLNKKEAFLCAFKSNVSSWDSKHKRGRGLNDLLSVAKGNDAWVRAESNQQGLLFDFRKPSDYICSKKSGTKENGTRFSMVLIDSKFEYVTKQEIDSILNNYQEQL